MPSYSRIVILFIALALVLTACAEPEAQATSAQSVSSPTLSVAAPTPTYAPTNTPEPTAVPRLATDVLVAGVDVGGLELEQAREKLDDALTPLLRSLDVEAGGAQL